MLGGFFNSLNNSFVLDDRIAIVQNDKVTGLQAARILREPSWFAIKDDKGWRPLTTLSFALDWKLHQGRAYWPRAENLALHTLASALVYFLALEIGLAQAGALIAGLLFALHPVHTEVINPIVGRGDLLAAISSLLTLILFLRGRFWALVPFGIGLFAKESIISLLFFLPVVVYWSPKEAVRRRILLLLGLGAQFAVYMCVRRLVTGIWMPGGSDTVFLDNPLIAVGAFSRIANALHVLWRYAALLVIPWPLSSDYSYDAIKILAPFSTRNVFSAAALGGIAFGLRAWHLRDGRAGFAAAFAAASMLLVSNIPFPIGTMMGDRLLYLPSAGFCLLAGLWLEAKSFRWAVLAALLLPYAALSHARNRDWKDDTAVFLAALRSAPDSIKAMTNAGDALLKLDRPLEARDQLLRAISKDARYSLTFSTLGLAYRKLGEPALAEEAFKKALSLDENFTDGWINLGIIYGEAGRYDDALAAMEKALALDPFSAKLHNNIGITYKRKGFWIASQGGARQAREPIEKAARHYRRAVELDPGYVQAANNLKVVEAWLAQ